MGPGAAPRVREPMARHGVCLVVGQLEIGGLEKQVYLLATGLDPRLFEVTVVSLSGGGVWAGALTRSGVRVLELNRHGHFDWRRFAALRQVFRELRPDLVYSFNYAGNAYARLAGLLAGVPILITGERDIYMSRFMALLERLLLPFTECVICNAEAIRRDLIDRVGLAGNKVITIPNAVVVPPAFGPEEKEAARRSIGAGVDEVVVGTITRIAAKKNLGMLVRAAGLCRTARAPVRFYIVAGGPDEKSLRDTIRERGLEKCITLLGPKEDAWTLLPGFDLFVLTSHIEGLPNTVMEAMAAGLPCICTDVGGCRELVEDGVTGYLVPPDDEQALLARIMEMAADPEARAAMGRLAREKIATAHSVERLVFRVQEVFLHLLSSARSRARGRRLSANFVEAR